jgi:hypothetical protein
MEKEKLTILHPLSCSTENNSDLVDGVLEVEDIQVGS